MGDKNKGDPPLQRQVLLRATDELAKKLNYLMDQADAAAGNPEAKVDASKLELHFENVRRGKKVRSGAVYIDEEKFDFDVKDLPCILECYKTNDKEEIYKTGNIAQILSVRGKIPQPPSSKKQESGKKAMKVEEEEEGKKAAILAAEELKKSVEKHVSDPTKENSGITPPTRHIRLDRFRYPPVKKNQVRKVYKLLHHMQQGKEYAERELIKVKVSAEEAKRLHVGTKILIRNGRVSLTNRRKTPQSGRIRRRSTTPGRQTTPRGGTPSHMPRPPTNPKTPSAAQRSPMPPPYPRAYASPQSAVRSAASPRPGSGTTPSQRLVSPHRPPLTPSTPSSAAQKSPLRRPPSTGDSAAGSAGFETPANSYHRREAHRPPSTGESAAGPMGGFETPANSYRRDSPASRISLSHGSTPLNPRVPITPLSVLVTPAQSRNSTPVSAGPSSASKADEPKPQKVEVSPELAAALSEQKEAKKEVDEARKKLRKEESELAEITNKLRKKKKQRKVDAAKKVLEEAEKKLATASTKVSSIRKE